MDSADVSSFQAKGYLVVPGVVSSGLLADLRREAEALIAADPPETKRRIWHERVLFRRKPFRDLIRLPKLIDAARLLQGEDAQLLALDLLYIAPGEGNIGWHRDVSFVCNKTLSINTGIYLQEMTDDAGPLRVVPGSHRWDEPPPSGETPEGAIVVPVEAGTAVFFDAGLWHSGGRNNTNQPRLAVFPYFGRYWIKRMDNHFTQPLPADLLAEKDPLIRQLLGLGLRDGAPNYHGDNEQYNRSRGEAGIDFPADEPIR